MRKGDLFILTFISAVLCVYCAAQDIHFDLVKPPKEEPWGWVRGLAQDSLGFLWITTDDGLYKYDGYKCTTFHNEPSNPNSLSSNWVECIYAEKNDFLLLGTHRTGLDRFDLSTGRFTNYRYNAEDPASLSNNVVTSIIKDRQGRYWIGTNDGLNQFNPRTGKFTRYKNNPKDSSSLSDDQVRVVYEDKNGTIWIGTKSPWYHDEGGRIGGLNCFNPQTGKFIRYMHKPNDPNSLIDNRVSAIFEDSRGTFWVGTAGDGLHTMNRTKGTFERHLYDPSHREKLSRPPVTNYPGSDRDDYITFINEDPKGNIWIGTINSGINVYNPFIQKTTHYGFSENSNEKLASNSFLRTYTTRDSVFWVGSFTSNLYKINPQKISFPYNKVGKEVTDIFEDRKGVLWIATSQGLIRKNKDGTERQYYIDKKVSSINNFISEIEEDNENGLWIATLFNGLYRFNLQTQTFTGYHHEPKKESSLLSDTVQAVAKTAGNKLWVGTSKGLDLMDIRSGKFKHFIFDPKDTTSLSAGSYGSNSQVYSIIVARDNTVWVCVGGDVNRFDEKTSKFKRYNIFPTAFILMEDSNGELWLTSDGGLFKYNKNTDSFIPYFDPFGIINKNTVLNNVREDHQKNLWLQTQKGFIKLNVEKSEVSVYENNPNSYSYPGIKSFYLTRSGEILSGDTSGYYAFHPESFSKNAQPPAIVISDFSLSDRPVIPGAGAVLTEPIYQTKDLSLKHNQNTFSFEFTGIDFTGNNEDKHLLFRLENYDTKWRKADEERMASYYNVPPGKYIFKVKAVNSNGIWAEKSISITIAQPWWTTWWAYCLYGLFFISAAYAIHRFQKQRVLRTERERARLRELAQAKEIEKAYHELKTTQTQLIQKEKMASLGELTAGIAHEIQNPLNFVNNFSEVNTELFEDMEQELDKGNIEEAKAIVSDIKENGKKINHHGKRADAIVKGMLQHSRASTGHKELTDINALADEYLRLSYHGLRAKDKSFNATIETHFDESIGKINVVPQDIGRVLLNLFNNAFYAVTEKKKALTGNTYEPIVSVSTKKLHDKVLITVKDNGPGIPPKAVGKIFQPFFTTKPTGQGTGLGLSLSYDIIKAHGGELKVETKEGEGAEFIIQLPISQ